MWWRNNSVSSSSSNPLLSPRHTMASRAPPERSHAAAQTVERRHRRKKLSGPPPPPPLEHAAKEVPKSGGAAVRLEALLFGRKFTRGKGGACRGDRGGTAAAAPAPLRGWISGLDVAMDVVDRIIAIIPAVAGMAALLVLPLWWLCVCGGVQSLIAGGAITRVLAREE